MLNIEKIGNDAGIVYQTLVHHHSQTLVKLRKLTKLKDKELLLAIGWLAREGKIQFEYILEEIYIELVRE